MRADLKHRLGLTVFEKAPCFVAVLDRDYRIVGSNDAFRRVFGDREGEHCYVTYKGMEEVCGRCVARRSFADGVARESEEEGVDRDGRPVCYKVAVVPVADANGTVDHILQMSLDTTRTHDLEKGLEQAERLANVGLTTAGLAHTIKNILAGLEGGIYVVDSGLAKDDGARIESGWSMVKKYVEQVTALVQNLLRYARAKRPEREPVAPAELIAEVAELYESKAALVGIELAVEPEGELPILVVDREAIAASLTNLVSNAMDACTWDPDLDKQHRLGISAHHQDGKVIFTVSDNGMGIADEDQHKILEAFFTTKGMRGTGLGLLLTKKAVAEHGGAVRFESVHGQGTSFFIELPVDAKLPATVGE